jgi:hypothetical protein
VLSRSTSAPRPPSSPSPVPDHPSSRCYAMAGAPSCSLSTSVQSATKHPNAIPFPRAISLCSKELGRSLVPHQHHLFASHHRSSDPLTGLRQSAAVAPCFGERLLRAPFSPFPPIWLAVHLLLSHAELQEQCEPPPVVGRCSLLSERCRTTSRLPSCRGPTGVVSPHPTHPLHFPDVRSAIATAARSSVRRRHSCHRASPAHDDHVWSERYRAERCAPDQPVSLLAWASQRSLLRTTCRQVLWAGAVGRI